MTDGFPRSPRRNRHVLAMNRERVLTLSGKSVSLNNANRAQVAARRKTREDHPDVSIMCRRERGDNEHLGGAGRS